jgi:hypothetical protein
MAGYANGGYVQASAAQPASVAPSFDYDRMAAAGGRQLYGNVYMTPHNYNQFRLEMERDMAAAAEDGWRR